MSLWIHNSWKRFDEASLPDKKAFYSKLDVEDITEEDNIHAQIVFEEFKLKNLGEYHDLYVQVINYCFQMYFKILEINVLKYMSLILFIFYVLLD